MQIRVSCHDATELVAVASVRTGDDMPEDVRFVDPAVADAVARLVAEAGDAVGEVDLDVVVSVASARARA